MTGLILHDYWRSSAAYRVRIALNLKGLAYERAPVNLLADAQKAADYRALNPQGLVPTLEIDGERLTQSLAIIDRLDALHPAPRLIPADPAARARVLEMALAIACDIHPVNNLRILKYLARLGIDQAARDDWYRHWIAEGFDALETMAARHAGRFLFGDAVTLADVCLVPQMFNARRLETPLDAWPTLVRADAAAAALPAFAAAHPERVAPADAGR
jgi:maleylacetoacetate isomerase